jgi:hypothetical protein
MAEKQTRQSRAGSLESILSKLAKPEIRLRSGTGLPGGDGETQPKSPTDPGQIFGPTSFADAQWAGLNNNRTQNNDANIENQLNAGMAGTNPIDANSADAGLTGTQTNAPGSVAAPVRPSYRYDSNKDGKIDDQDDIDPKYKMGRGQNILGGMRLGGMMGQQYSNPWARLGSVIGGAVKGMMGGNPGGELKYQEDLANYNKELTLTQSELTVREAQLRLEEAAAKAESAKRTRERLANLTAEVARITPGANPTVALNAATEFLADPTQTDEDARREATRLRNTALASSVGAEQGATLPPDVAQNVTNAINNSVIDPAQVLGVTYTASGNLRFQLKGGKTLTIDPNSLDSDKAVSNSRKRLKDLIAANAKTKAFMETWGVTADFIIDQLALVEGTDVSVNMDKLHEQINSFDGEDFAQFSFNRSSSTASVPMSAVLGAKNTQEENIAKARADQSRTERVVIVPAPPPKAVRQYGEIVPTERALPLTTTAAKDNPTLGITSNHRQVTLNPGDDKTGSLFQEALSAVESLRPNTQEGSTVGDGFTFVQKEEMADGDNTNVFVFLQRGGHTYIIKYVRIKDSAKSRAGKPVYRDDYLEGISMILNNDKIRIRTRAAR